MRQLFARSAMTLTLLATLSIGQLQADPWGKDADLVGFHPDRAAVALEPTRGNPIAEALIAFHQNVISPADGPRSHFRPSSSQYALDAIRKYGFFKGFAMGCDRLMRENDEVWVYRIGCLPDGSSIKLDPVR
ncbi:Uncharacterized protein SCG7086_CQ_00040 [Chlamydiales bacterium SCGC AG-110-P3]|nr:Uncharacterized protein SCG7086_CQ_00040 [Chlamydiales bacterium SCGC AG-110-P3]